jgi:NitT/TauT family transport system substrate-binding protein
MNTRFPASPRGLASRLRFGDITGRRTGHSAFRRLGLGATAAISALALVAGCGSSGSTNTSGNGLEKTHITVGSLPIPDGAALYIAIKRGFFKQVGLTVTTKVINSGAIVNQDMLAGTIDVGQGNYVSDIEAQAQGGKWKMLAPATAGAPNAFALLVAKDSNITSPAQMAGKTIAVPTLKAIGPLLVTSALNAYGVKASQIHFTLVPFPDMAAALKTGQVQGMFCTEPWCTASESGIGAKSLVDLTAANLPTADVPVASWAATASWVKKYPKTAAAFEKAIDEGQAVAAGNRTAIEQVLPTYTAIKPNIASVITLSNFPTTVTASQLLRLTALMTQYGFIPSSDNTSSFVQDMLVSGS